MIYFFARPATIRQAITACEITDMDFEGLRIPKRAVIAMTVKSKETIKDVLTDVTQGNRERLEIRAKKAHDQHVGP